MLRSLNALLGYRILADDGPAGKVCDFLFHETDWTIGHVIADVGSWWHTRRVLVPRVALKRPVGIIEVLPISWKRSQVKGSPVAESVGQVTQQLSNLVASGSVAVPAQEEPLCSTVEVTGYQANAMDGQIGTVEDFIVDDEEWHIRYLVLGIKLDKVDRRALSASEWVVGIDKDAKVVSLNLSRREVYDSPEYDPRVPINRDIEGRLYDYYGQPFGRD